MSFYQKVLDYQKKAQVYIVAEVGSNYRSKQDLLGAIALAKNLGADAVKFQYLTPEELYGASYKICPVFPLHSLAEKARACGIDFLCTAFSPEGLRKVDEFVPAHKIASSEMSHIRLLEAAVATKKPIILSTGAYFLPDIQRVLKFLGGHDTILMHCNVAYPAKHVNIPKFEALQDIFKGPIGFSDHTTSIDVVPLVFKNARVAVYEKHFNPFNYTDTPDASHSLNAPEFQAFVKTLRGERVDYSEENEARVKHVRRVIALNNILEGETLKEGVNIGIFRTNKPDAKGANPFMIVKMHGKQAVRDIKGGEGVSPMDVR